MTDPSERELLKSILIELNNLHDRAGDIHYVLIDILKRLEQTPAVAPPATPEKPPHSCYTCPD